jgi:hypothetical protein
MDGVMDFFTGGSSGKADKLSQESTDLWKGLQTPELSDLQVELEDAVYRGDVTVEQAQQILQDRSQMYGISLDPKFKQAQMNALKSLEDIGQNKGLTDMDRAQLSKIQAQEAAQQRGSREAILQNAQARGMGGSGLELMSQLQNQQSSADRQAARDTDVAGMAQQRALQALQSAGQLGTQYSDQSFGQQAAVAGAQDRINQFNAQTGNEMNRFNTGAINAGNMRDANTLQDVSNMNTGIRNTQSTQNANAVQDSFQNQLNKTQGTTGALQNQADQTTAAGNAKKDMWGNIIGTVGRGVAAYYTGGASEAALAAAEKKKKEEGQ